MKMGPKFGHVVSAETREKIRLKKLGQKHSEETKKKISVGNKGKVPTEAMKRRIQNIIDSGIKPPVMFGTDHPNWKGGLTPLKQKIRNCFEYRQWRCDVFTRDSFTCQHCGDGRGGKLEADHIKPFSYIINFNEITTFEAALKCEELWNINNGRTLCRSCHEKTPTYSWRGGRIS